MVLTIGRFIQLIPTMTMALIEILQGCIGRRPENIILSIHSSYLLVIYVTLPAKCDPIKYPKLSGIKTAPSCHLVGLGFICTINHIGTHGSRIAMDDVQMHMDKPEINVTLSFNSVTH